MNLWGEPQRVPILHRPLLKVSDKWCTHAQLLQLDLVAALQYQFFVHFVLIFVTIAGLPDLLLIRANYESESDPIDLGQWLGEVFSVDDNNLKFALDTIDTNDYLGCSDKEMKLKCNGQKLRSSLAPCTEQNEKLQMLLHGRKVEVKCMVVEVKSKSDSLDERQEDWLNIIDRAIPYHARVCKFTDSDNNI